MMEVVVGSFCSWIGVGELVACPCMPDKFKGGDDFMSL